MASSPSLLCINTVVVIIAVIITCFLTPKLHDDVVVKLPFHPRDVLPLLPRQVSLPILKYTLRNPADLLPALVGCASSNHTLPWKGACFNDNTAWLEFHNKTHTKFGGGTLHIKVSKAHSLTCMDLYIFATPFQVKWDDYLLSGDHIVDFEWGSKSEYEYVKRMGVCIFLMKGGMLGTLKALREVFPLFTNSTWGENSNIEFLKKYMGASFNQRPQPWVTNINPDDVHSGDFLAVSTIRGRWGGFETLEKWVTGSYAGHSAVCLKDSEGKLWVGESGHDNDQGKSVIVILPWEEWWESVQNNDESNVHIALLPLHPDVRAKFNEAAAWEYAKSMEGKPYGYHNMIFSWIDTTHKNYPPPLDALTVASFMTIWTQFAPEYASNLWNEALNKRLGTQGLDLANIIVEAEKRGISFGELLAIPEQDDWVYSDGKSATCVVYVVQIYKAAGLFDSSIATSIQATEFTVKDAYMLKFFESNSSRLPKWCKEGDNVELPFCQIKGKYRMELPEYNTLQPYPHMNEKCPSLPPHYSRPKNC